MECNEGVRRNAAGPVEKDERIKEGLGLSYEYAKTLKPNPNRKKH
jgi:hypothetical protein